MMELKSIEEDEAELNKRITESDEKNFPNIKKWETKNKIAFLLRREYF